MRKRNLGPEVGSLVVFAMSVFVLLALVSFQADDPTFLSRGYGAVQNLCGRVGANLAVALLNGFGVGAFLVPAAFFFVAASLYRADELGESLSRSLAVLAGMTVAVVSLTVLVSLHWRYWSFSGAQLLVGGALGAWLSQMLELQVGRIGGSVIAALVLSISIVSSTPIRLARWGGRAIAAATRASLRVGRILGGYALYLTGVGMLRLSRIVGSQAKRLGERVATASRALTLPAFSAPKPLTQIAEGVANPISIAPSESNSTEPQEFEFNDGEVASAVTTLSATAVVQERAVPILPHELRVEAPAGAGAQTAKPLARRPSRMGNWKLPTMEFLKKVPKVESSIDKARLQQSAQILVQKFKDFGIDGEVTAVRPGPVITLFEFKPGPGVKVSRIASLADDLSMALSAQSVRILAPLPGKAVVGIEIPSDHREVVYLKEFLQQPDFNGPKFAIPVVMGKDIGGLPILSDLAKMPHLLCAGQTGSGKSVFMNGLICSLFYRFTPDELRMILVDPKFIEFRAYQDMPHLLLPVVDDPKQAATALKWAVQEMERRYRILAKLGARNLASFNQKIDEMGVDVVRDLLLSEDESETQQIKASGGDWMEAFEPDDQGIPKVGKLPFIVVIIDELADLMMVAKKEVEVSIARIAQKARAAGIHLIIATQRPSTDVITGLIKANLPSRVSFQLASFVDSKTILDRAGAERLLGQGDMLFIPPGSSQPVRLHGAYLDDDEIHKITSFLKAQGKPLYRDEILLVEEDEEEGDLDAMIGDERYEEAVELVKRTGHASASFIQRHLKVGYNRAARMIENMEERGIVGPAEGARPREVLER